MVYRQYLENVRGSINNFVLPELKSKEFMGITQRVAEIEDLSYIDVILKNAGLEISFIGDRKFLNEKVVLKSKLDRYFDDETFVKDTTMKSALSEYMSMFIIEEDEIIDSIEEITGEDGIAEISLDYFPQSSAKYYSAQEILEKNKETLTALFGAVDEMNKKLNQEEEQSKQFVEEFFDEETEDDELTLDGSDIRDLISDEVEEKVKPKEDLVKEEETIKPIEKKVSEPIVEKEPVKLSFSIEKEENVVETEDDIEEEIDNDIDVEVEEKPISAPIEEVPIVSQNRKMDTSFLSDDEDEEVEDKSKVPEEDFEDYDEYSELSKKDFNKFLEQDEDTDEDESEIEEDSDYSLEEQEDDYEDDYGQIIDNTGKVLARELEDDEDRLLRDTDPVERNIIEETANYFLTGKSEVYGKDDLRSLYKTKQKIIESDDVSSTDDAVAKMVLAMTDGLLNLPRVTGKLFKKAKNSGRKMRENMIVEDEEDDG